MEATFQSYLTEAVYEAASRGCSTVDPISYIDDSDDGDRPPQQPPPLPVKMRVKSATRRGPRPSGILEPQPQQPPTLMTSKSSPSPPLFIRNSKFCLSVKRRSSTFYLQRSQSTKEVGSNFSLFKNFPGLKRTPTWSSVVAHLNRSFRAASTTSNETEAGSKPAKVWRRSQSCRNIERLFSNRRYYTIRSISGNSSPIYDYLVRGDTRKGVSRGYCWCSKTCERRSWSRK